MNVTGELPPDIGNYAWEGFNSDYADMYMYKPDEYYVSGGATYTQHPPGAPAGELLLYPLPRNAAWSLQAS
jgi:hypothetical protein